MVSGAEKSGCVKQALHIYCTRGIWKVIRLLTL